MFDESLPTAVAVRIDSLCQEFETALKEGRSPDIESYVEKAERADRGVLRRELQRIADDFQSGHASLRVDPETKPLHAAPTDPFQTTAQDTPGIPQVGGSEPCSVVPISDGMTPTEIGRYQVMGVLGKGGFGVVYRGFDPELRRDVAIKVPLTGKGAAFADTYLAEAQTVAGLDHSGIVPVYDVGRTEDGQCYVVSKFVAGSDLARLIARGRPDFRRAAEIVAQVAEALDHAHQRGLVHRDIKPANILLDEKERPLVADFGLALSDDSFGRGAGFCGTVPYMSPEQAAGESHLLDARSDIYSLGVVFYELLAGRRPYRQNQTPALLEEITNSDIRPPRQLDHTIPDELERICLRALAKRPSERYTTAFDLASDLRRFLDGEPLPAPKPARKSRDPIRWKKLGTGATAVLAFVGCAALVANTLTRDNSPAHFTALALKVAPIRDNRAVEEDTETFSLVADGEADAGLPGGQLSLDEAFKLEGRFARACYWRLFWLDTKNHWTAATAPDDAEADFAYPVNKKMVSVDASDPLGTHLLVVVASDRPIDDAVANLPTTAPPAVEQLMFWSKGVEATSRGPGTELETTDSYLLSLGKSLPDGQQIVAALFLPVGP